MATNRKALNPLVALARDPAKARDFVIALRQAEEDYPGTARSFWALTKYDNNLVSTKALDMIGEIEKRDPGAYMREIMGIYPNHDGADE